MSNYTPWEMMTVVAARMLKDDDVCFVGIGAPSAACNLARLTHAPNITLIYESGTIGSKPTMLPLSIGDGELCETALTTCSIPEMFRYWLQGNRINVGFLGAAQIDRHANLNTTVIGPYEKPSTRLPGGGGAPEVATGCGRILVVMKHSRRGFVEKLDFVTTFGHGRGSDGRAQLNLKTSGPTHVITDLCVMETDATTKELKVVSLHPGVKPGDVIDSTGWPVRFADPANETPLPTPQELKTLRSLANNSPRAGS